jgi:hypothetical protein
MKTVLNLLNNNVMKNAIKYICALLLLTGVSVNAWGTTCTLYGGLNGATTITTITNGQTIPACSTAGGSWDIATNWASKTYWTTTKYSASSPTTTAPDPSKSYCYLSGDVLDDGITALYAVYVLDGTYYSGAPGYQIDLTPTSGATGYADATKYMAIQPGTSITITAHPADGKVVTDWSVLDGGGDDITRGKLEVNPAIVQYLWEQYTGGPGKVFSNTISIGKDAKDLLVNGEAPDFNMRKVEGLKAFVQQGDDRTDFYRANAKYRKYKEDAERLYDAVNGYQEAASTDPLALPKLEKISMSQDFVRMQIVREADKQLSKINKAANKAEGKERKELRKLYNEQVKAVVDMLDEVEK